MSRRLYKSDENRMVEGVCGGIAEYFGIDPALVRVGWVLFCVLGGSGVLAYIIAAMIFLAKVKDPVKKLKELEKRATARRDD